MKKCNAEIRQAAREAGVAHWQIAQEYGISETSYSRKLREELSKEEKDEILEIINELKIVNEADDQMASMVEFMPENYADEEDVPIKSSRDLFTGCVADRLTYLRAKSRCTYHQIEKGTGIKRCTLASYEIGRSVMSAYNAVQLAKYYGVTVGWLLTGEDGA